jgi:hypothetical protein
LDTPELAVEIPLDKLALPLRRPDLARIGDRDEERQASSRSRRARLLHMQRQLRRERQQARKRAGDSPEWVPEALYGNRFYRRERYFP